jgi:hypothetical protein
MAAIGLAGCAATTAPSARIASASPKPEPELTVPPGGITPPPSETASPGVLPPAIGGEIHCLGLDVTIPPGIFAAPATAERAANGPAAALRNYVHDASNVATGWPASGWRLVGASDDRATFLARAATTWWIATFARDGIDWTFFEGGNCDLQVVLPDGIGFASWRIDPANAPKPGDTTLHLLGTELACANGRPPLGRVRAPIVLPAADAVTIALLVRTIPGGADCPGNPEFPIDVGLSEPLGSRTLFDGSTTPPSSRS